MPSTALASVPCETNCPKRKEGPRDGVRATYHSTINAPVPWNPLKASEFYSDQQWRTQMTFGKGALLWLIGIPLPIILLLALFWR